MRMLLAAWTAALLLATAPAAPAGPLHQDVNGDGLDDVAVADLIDSIDSEGATVFFGSRDRAAPPSRTDPAPRGFRIAAAGEGESMSEAAVLGDVNGDGLADVLVTDGHSGLHVVWGKKDTERVWPFEDGFARSGEGLSIEVSTIRMPQAGDFNGDGLADVVHVTETRRTAARVRFGSRVRPLRRGFVIRLGGRVRRIVRPNPVALGDVNGDGLDDLAVAIADPNGRRDGFDVEEMVFLVWGKKDRRPVTLTQGRRSSSARVLSGGRRGGRAIFHARRGCWCDAGELGPAGDLDGDGRDELAILWSDVFNFRRSRLDIVFGSRRTSAAVLPGSAGATVTGADPYGTFAPFGDRDGDGRDDLLVVARRGRAALRLLSGRRARGTLDAASLPQTVRGSVEVARPAGDVDGDGEEDVLLGDTNIDGGPTWFAMLHGATPQPRTIRRRPDGTLVRWP